MFNDAVETVLPVTHRSLPIGAVSWWSYSHTIISQREPSLGKHGDRFGEDIALECKHALSEAFSVILLFHGTGSLEDDGSLVIHVIHEMHGAA